MGMRFAPTWLRQVSPLLHDYFNHCVSHVQAKEGERSNSTGQRSLGQVRRWQYKSWH